VADPTKNPNPNAGKKAAPRAKRETAAADATALYPLPPDAVDEKAVKVLAEREYGDQTVRVMTDDKSVWKEVG
jgi:hypothetical protein